MQIQQIPINQLIHGECLEKMKTMSDNSVDSIVTDPPYGLKFMGKKWDYNVPGIEIWEECLRVLKPGGYLLCFAGTRTHHRMAVNIEDACFEIRDMIAWVYGSGFPKSHNISKAIDKMAGAERERVGFKIEPGGRCMANEPAADRKRKDSTDEHSHRKYGVDKRSLKEYKTITAPATPEAQQWDGWGTALKPALEPITIARKPLSEKTVAANILKWGTGGINIDASRVETSEDTGRPQGTMPQPMDWGNRSRDEGFITKTHSQGRFPANLIHDGSEEVKALFPETKSGTILPHHKTRESENNCMSGKNYARTGKTSIGDNGSAARFFYCAKASKKDRDEGLDGFADKQTRRYGDRGQGVLPKQTPQKEVINKNNHPTVKPTALMRYLVRLVTPPDGTVLDPFMGSGTTGKACKLESLGFIGIEQDEHSFNISKARIKNIHRKGAEYAK